MNPDMLARLHDIRGLDPIPWWPPAIGWWLLAAGAVVLLFALRPLLRNLLRYPAGSWRRSAWKQLCTLQRQADRMPPMQLAAELSELLRRIAMARLGRSSAAGLSGERWLSWLREHDPAGFDWNRHGHPLLTLPYAPPGSDTADSRQLRLLIDAAFPWVDRSSGGRHA